MMPYPPVTPMPRQPSAAKRKRPAKKSTAKKRKKATPAAARPTPPAASTYYTPPPPKPKKQKKKKPVDLVYVPSYPHEPVAPQMPVVADDQAQSRSRRLIKPTKQYEASLGLVGRHCFVVSIFFFFFFSRCLFFLRSSLIMNLSRWNHSRVRMPL